MAEHLLNENQARRVSTLLRLLKADLEEMRSWHELRRPGEPYEAIRESLAQLLASADELRTALSLPPYRAPSLLRRVAATAQMWAISAEEMKSHGLRGYGGVHAGLPGVLDERVDRIVEQLRTLADLAGQLPER